MSGCCSPWDELSLMGVTSGEWFDKAASERCVGIAPPKSTEGRFTSVYTHTFALKGIFHGGDWCMASCSVGTHNERPWKIPMLGVQQRTFSRCFAELWAAAGGSSVYLHPVGDRCQCLCPGGFPAFGENQLACKYRPINLDGWNIITFCKENYHTLHCICKWKRY